MSHDATTVRRASRRVLGAFLGAVVLAGVPAATAARSCRPRPATRASGLRGRPDERRDRFARSRAPGQPAVAGRGQRYELGPGLPGRLRVQRQLQRHQHLQHRQPGEPDADDVDHLPGQPERRVGLEEPAVHVGRGDRARRRTARRRRRPTPTTRFRGVRIFDISNIEAPDAGRRRPDVPRLAHAHARASEERPGERLHLRAGHGRRARRDRARGLRRTARPRTRTRRSGGSRSSRSRWRPRPTAAIVNEPRLFSERATGALNGLQNAPQTPQHPSRDAAGRPDARTRTHCHDITVYEELDLAAGACAGNGLLIDISDPANPKRIDSVADPLFAYWHGATFSNDGKAVLFTDEWGGGTAARCRATDQLSWGADAIYEIVNRKLVFRSYYKLPVAQTHQRELRQPRRQPDPGPGPQHLGPGVVPGRRVAGRLHRPRASPKEIALLRPRPDRHGTSARLRRLLVDLLVQRPHLRLGDRARVRLVRARRRRRT